MFFDGIMFEIVPILVGLGFLGMFGWILYTVFSNVKEGVHNNNSPLLTVPAQVVAKRIHVQGDHSHTTYYVTFEVQSGDRMEFRLDGTEYGELVEQDLGLLTFQGTRYKAFERQK